MPIKLNGATSGSVELGVPAAIGSDLNITIPATAGEVVVKDAADRVLIGTTTPGQSTADNLTIADSGHCGITLRSGSSEVGTIFFSDGTSGDAEYRGYVQYDHSGDFLKWATAGSERMRIDDDGQMLLGETSAGGTCKLGMSFGNAVGNYMELGGTSRAANGLSKVFVFRHGYWGGNREVASVGVQTTSSPGGAGHGYGDLVFHTGESGNGDSGSTSAERMRIHSGGKLNVPGVYAGTTTGGSAVYVESDGDLLRYTSSLKYKTDVETIEDARADAILNCRPVWYRSKCENDIKTEGSEKSDWGWYGFIAEEVAKIEPRLVSWATKDGVKQDDGSVKSVERDPANYEAEGVRYDNFVPLLVNLVKRQQAAIETLEAKVAALESA